MNLFAISTASIKVVSSFIIAPAIHTKNEAFVIIRRKYHVSIMW